MAAEQVRSEVLAGVRMLNGSQLEDCCEKLKLTVADAKKGNKRALENVVIRYLTSEDLENTDDEGMSEFLMLNDHIKTLLDMQATNTLNQLSTTLSQVMTNAMSGANTTPPTPTPQVVVKKEDADAAPAAAVTTKVELHKLREFKINGGTVPDSIDYINLSNQMADGIEAGYAEKEVRNGVVRAMKPGTSLRRFFEGPLARKMTDKEFRDALRSYYEQEDSETLQEQLRKAVQKEGQMEKDFLLDMIDLRDKLEVTSAAEGCPISKPVLRRKFTHALAVGFRKETIRLEMQGVLKRDDWTDNQLREELRLIVKNDKEHRDKTAGQKKDANVTMLDIDRGAANAKSKETLSATVERVVTDKVNKMEAKLEAKLDRLLGEIASNNVDAKDGEHRRNQKSGPGRTKKFKKCEACEASGAFCKHCSNCGNFGHKRYYCPEAEREKNE